MKKTSNMRKLGMALCALAIAFGAAAQTDSTKKETADTIKVGGMVIIRKSNGSSEDKKNDVVVVNRNRSNAKVSTNWWIVDIGFANFSDQTNYASPEAQAFAPGFSKDGMELSTGRSLNVNLWIFMQKIRLVKNAVSLKYGLGLEMNNYRFDDERIRLQEDPTRFTLDQSLLGIKKNKLAADYLTVPVMLNFNLTPKRNKGFGFAAGVSGGYLYSARQKFKNDGDVDKNHDDFDLRKFKLSYIGELSLGPVKLYGSYATRSMWERGLEQTPYNFGVRFSYF